MMVVMACLVCFVTGVDARVRLAELPRVEIGLPVQQFSEEVRRRGILYDAEEGPSLSDVSPFSTQYMHTHLGLYILS